MKTMRLLSWNIQWGRGADGRIDLERVIEVLRAPGAGTDLGTAEADFICLQEVARHLVGLPGDDGAGVGDQPARLREAFPHLHWTYLPSFDVPAPHGRGGFGNLLGSRWPLGQVRGHLLPSPTKAHRPSLQRGLIEAVVLAPGRSFRLLTTHLEYYGEAVRLAQVRRINDLQAEAMCAATSGAGGHAERNPVFAPLPRPVDALLCGDLNALPDSRVLRALCDGPDAPWQDAWRVLAPERGHAPTVGVNGAAWPDHPYCCDYVLAAGTMVDALRGLCVDAHTAASDHQPLICDFVR